MVGVGLWSLLALFRGMDMKYASSSSSVVAVLFFAFCTWLVTEVWGNLLVHTLAKLCRRWTTERGAERAVGQRTTELRSSVPS